MFFGEERREPGSSGYDCVINTPLQRGGLLTEWTNNGFNRFMKRMSLHSYSRCWLHVIWATLKREGIFDKSAAAKVSAYLTEYAQTKGIHMTINYVNPDHVHALIDLPTNYSLENAMQYLKGGSSFWINEQQIVCGKFSWGRGYGAFSVSESLVAQVAHYIATQEEHHRKKSFLEEFQVFVSKHNLQWRDDRTV